VSGLSRNARKRLALYGVAALVLLAVWGAPRILRRLQPPVRVRDLDAEAAATLGTDAAKLLVELVRIDTSNPPGITRPVVDVLARELSCAGIPYELTGADPRRPILVARLAGRTRGEALALLSHADVVPPGDLADWKRPPFAGVVGEGPDRANLVGRGTLDMKGQAVANLLALASLARRGIVPTRDILYVVESGEESYDPSLGFGWLLEHRPDLVRDVFNEGGVNEVKTVDVERFGIEVLQKAILSVEVLAKERKPLEDFAAFVKERDDAIPIRVDAAVQEFFRFIAPSRSDIWGRRMMEDPAKIGPGTEFWQYVPEVYRSLLKDMLYAGRVVEAPGGFSLKVVWTFLPGSSVAAANKELDGWISARGLSRKLVLRTDDAVASPTAGPAWRAAAEAFALDPAHAPVGPYVLSGQYTSSSYLRARGLRAYGVSPFALNFFDASSIHHPNERIPLGVFVEGVARMHRVLLEFATAP
jgi:acetylornithine deacetylase/succinyl-diaminopimelate desuccinylase-like protein